MHTHGNQHKEETLNIGKHKRLVLIAGLVYLAIIGMYTLTGVALEIDLIYAFLVGLATPPASAILGGIIIAVFLVLRKTLFALCGVKKDTDQY